MAINLNSEKHEKFFKALFVGATGTGKTIAASSWPGKTLIVDFDDRHKPVIEWYADRVKNGDFAVESVNAENFNRVMKELTTNLKQFNPYQNIIVDGITSVTMTTVLMLILNKVGLAGVFGKNEPTKENKGSKVLSSGVIVPGWDEFNAQAIIVAHLIEFFKGQKCNLFVTAHPVRRTLIGEGNKAEHRSSIVAFGPKMESIIPTYFDEVWYFDYSVESDNQGREMIKRILHTQPAEKYLDCKTALKIPKTIDYTDRNLFDLVKDYL